MTGSKLQRLLLLLGACSAGFAFAGAGDITKRDPGSSSVELTNMGDEDAPVVVAVPARTASVPATPVAAERPASVRPTVQRDKRLRDQDEEELAEGEQPGGTAEPRAEQPTGVARSDWGQADSVAGSSGFTGNFGYGAPTFGGPTGSTGDGNRSNPGDTPAPSQPPPSSQQPSAPPSPPVALDSPQRWENYRWIKLNEPRGPNGQVANPAVQRRYLRTY